MTSTKSLVVAMTLAALTAASGAQAADSSSELTMKPQHGISFDVGSERAVSYFVSENGQCKLVVALAGEPEWGVPALTTTRVEAEIPGGKAAQLTLSEGKALEFACQPGAQAMSVRPVEQIAAGSVR
jgi:hypothetical protein